MTWIKISDTVANHPKFIGLSNEAFALWVKALGYAKHYRTDGSVPVGALRGLANHPKPTKVAQELVAARLWEPTEAGYHIHDYLDHNDSRDDVERKIGDAKQRKERWRDKRTGQFGTEKERVPERERNASGTRVERPPETETDTETDTDTDTETNKERESTQVELAPCQPEQIAPSALAPATPAPLSQDAIPEALDTKDDADLATEIERPSKAPKRGSNRASYGPAVTAEVTQVFEAYLAGWSKHVGKGSAPVITDKRAKLIKARIKDHGIEVVTAAASGIWASQWHRENAQTSIDLAMRDAAHVERFSSPAGTQHQSFGRDSRNRPVQPMTEGQSSMPLDEWMKKNQASKGDDDDSVF